MGCGNGREDEEGQMRSKHPGRWTGFTPLHKRFALFAGRRLFICLVSRLGPDGPVAVLLKSCLDSHAEQKCCNMRLLLPFWAGQEKQK